MLDHPVNHLQADDAAKVAGIVRNHSQSFTQRDACNQQIHFTDKLAALLEVSPDISSQYSGCVSQRKKTMKLAKTLESGELGHRAFGFESARDFVVTKLGEGQMPKLCEIRSGVKGNLRMAFAKQAQRISVQQGDHQGVSI